MSEDKYPSIFSPQMATIVFSILKSLWQGAQFSKLGNIRSRDPLRPIGRELKDLMDYKLT